MDGCHALFQHSGLYCEGPETAHVLLNGSPFAGVSLLSLGACHTPRPLACAALPHRTSQLGATLAAASPLKSRAGQRYPVDKLSHLRVYHGRADYKVLAVSLSIRQPRSLATHLLGNPDD